MASGSVTLFLLGGIDGGMSTVSVTVANSALR